MKSLWMDWKLKSSAKQLKEDITRDIVIIGGGISGLLTAYRLSQYNQKVTLLEASTLCSGVTSYTSAHISALQGYKYDTLKLSQIQDYYSWQITAINEYERIINELKIDCDFERVDDYLYGLIDLDKIEKEYDTLAEIGANPKYVNDFSISTYKPKAAFKVENMAVFHPLKFLDALPKNFEYYENTRVKSIDFDTKEIFTETAKINANKIIVATGFPIVDIPGWYFLKMYKSQAYSIAVEKVDNIKASYQSEVSSGVTFRSYKDKLIIDGLDHRTGRVNANDKFQTLEEIAEKLYPNTKVTHRWTANDCMTFDGIPYIGQYSKSKKDIYVITGFHKWGIANAMVASIIITDIILNRPNDGIKLFSPQRCILKPKAMLSNTVSIVQNLIVKPLCPAVKTEKSLPPDSGGIVKFNGKKKAVYKDINNNIYASDPLCQHLKCQLQFNDNTKTWDCPCHGSRYDIYGNIIVSPTVKKLNNEIVKD